MNRLQSRKSEGVYFKLGTISIRFCSINNIYTIESQLVPPFPVALNTLEMIACPVDPDQMELWRIAYHLVNGLRSSIEVLQDSSKFQNQKFLSY